jgi:hypothetical protein
MSKQTVTERTFYPSLIEIVRDFGGKGVQETSFDTYPDIVFQLGGRSWILSVKIGDSPTQIKGAFIQYLRHKEESGYEFGILLILPDSVRLTEPTEDAVRDAIQQARVTALVDAKFAKEEIRDRTFREIISFIKVEILQRLAQKKKSYYSLKFVISLLQEQVSDIMKIIKLDEDAVLKIITDEDLLRNLGHLDKTQSANVAQFLASYILMSQILFFRLMYSANPSYFKDPIAPVSPHSLRKAFNRILDINYRPIYAFDVMDSVSEKFIKDTFDLIWGLEIENVKHDLPGRIFHELMPSTIRKMLAAFYTRPHASDILSNLSINKSDDTVFDPACGSGTIIVSAYKKKLELHRMEGKSGNPHKRFVEEEIYGSDIMPFAVHLTSANLAATDVGTTIERTQIIQGDSLGFYPDVIQHGGVTLSLFPETRKAKTSKGDTYDVSLKLNDAIIMNPPFTKVERGISKFVDMSHFYEVCGGEVGLWGHFIALSRIFLKKEGTLGTVIPINILRGRESYKVRNILFKEMTPLYILKATRNYGFSEWAEYRDILFIAKNSVPEKDHLIKFCLIKKELNQLTESDVELITQNIQSDSHLRTDYLDIDSHNIGEVIKRFNNMMWFCGITDLRSRDRILKFVNKFCDKLSRFKENYFLEGYRPVPEGVSKFLFLTRNNNTTRTQEAFLRFDSMGESQTFVESTSPLGASFKFDKKILTRTLRTPIGLSRMDLTGQEDYIVKEPFGTLKKLLSATGFVQKKGFSWGRFWGNIKEELQRVETQIAVVHRINPYSPSMNIIAFHSDNKYSPSNQFNVIVENNPNKAKAICAVLNSSIFLSQFFLLKEESTGRYINIRFYDLNEMYLCPSNNAMVDSLAKVYNKYKKHSFPSLSEQIDTNFVERYQEFWATEAGDKQTKLWSFIDRPVEPSLIRLTFDLDVCEALQVDITKDELIALYEILVKEMIITRHLKRD